MYVNRMTYGTRRSGAPPGILGDGNTAAWFDSSDTYITKDGGDFVSKWSDRSGNANHLLQATGTHQPLWQATGVLFDGVDNFMKCSAFTFNQPEQIYILFKQVTWTANDRIFDGNVNLSGILYQTGTTPDIQIYASTNSPANANLAINTWGIVRVLFNGAASSLQVNETAKWTGNAGANNMSGFVLGARGDGTSSWGNIEVKDVILRNVIDGSINEAIIYNYLATKL